MRAYLTTAISGTAKIQNSSCYQKWIKLKICIHGWGRLICQSKTTCYLSDRCHYTRRFEYTYTVLILLNHNKTLRIKFTIHIYVEISSMVQISIRHGIYRCFLSPVPSVNVNNFVNILPRFLKLLFHLTKNLTFIYQLNLLNILLCFGLHLIPCQVGPQLQHAVPPMVFSPTLPIFSLKSEYFCGIQYTLYFQEQSTLNSPFGLGLGYRGPFVFLYELWNILAKPGLRGI